MLDKTIPYYNILMKCPYISRDKAIYLPYGYTFKTYEDGDEAAWADIERAAGDFEDITKEETVDYFRKQYFPHKEELYERCMFALDEKKKPVGTCMAWFDNKDNKRAASIHWLCVSPRIQGKGIGRALLWKTMSLFESKGEVPVYLHTQPWSFQAVSLYLSAGFYAMKSETFAGFENQYSLAAEVLKEYLSSETFKAFVNTAE